MNPSTGHLVNLDDEDVQRRIARSLIDYARMFPGALVAPHGFGDRASRAELLYYGAEPAVDFVSG